MYSDNYKGNAYALRGLHLFYLLRAHADLLNGDSKWVIRRIAGCYRALKQPEKALGYYQRYEALSPDNLSVTISIGHCHLELKNFSEALKCYFKVEYLDPESHKAWRPIAWCSFLTGKFEQARNYYGKIMGNAPSLQDMLNAGHTEWALQNIKGALSFYQQAVQMENGNILKFQEQFSQDVADLLIAGIEEAEVALMLDQLRYKIEGAI
jgi:tetratricopeptide (TPR) repeat protein